MWEWVTGDDVIHKMTNAGEAGFRIHHHRNPTNLKLHDDSPSTLPSGGKLLLLRKRRQ
jgi:hypothetical protein